MALYDKASLVLIPSGTKEGVVFSQKPTNGDGDFTFTRASSATRVNSDGLIEKETQNLFLQSNQFDTTWSPIGASVTSGQSGYDGSSDAWLLNKSLAGGFIQQSISSSGVQTYSIYAKAGSLNYMRLRVSGSLSALVYFDFTDGSIHNNDGFDATMVSVGGGWYRCSYSFVSTITAVQIYPADSINSVSGASGSIYIQDAQLNQGLVADSYLETTTTAVYGGITDNIPRLDYTDASCPSLLLEPQRTNLITHSEYLDGLLGVVNGSVSYNTTTSPEGLNNAALYTEDSSTNAHYIDSNSFTYTGGSNHIISVFAKYNGRFLTLQGTSFIIGTSYATFNLQTGEVEEESIGTASIEDYGNGWYRCSLKVTASSTSTGLATLLLNDIATGGRSRSYTGDGSSGLYYYGFQVEASSYATSYIPTYGASVTRVQDLSVTASPSTSYFGQTEGTIFTEIKINAITSGSYSRVLNLKNSGGSNQIYFQQNDSRILGTVFNGSNQFTQNTSSGFLSVGSTYKIAMAYKDGDYALYINGTQIGTSSASGLGTLDVDRVDLTTLSGNINLGNEIKQSLVFNTRLSNEELEALTQV
jgi:hypothetical protein